VSQFKPCSSISFSRTEGHKANSQVSSALNEICPELDSQLLHVGIEQNLVA